MYQHIKCTEKWREKHGNVIKTFLQYLNKNSDRYVLKGGTGLMMCYRLDRFSEDIDLNSTDKNSIKKIVGKYCTNSGYSYRIAKDTPTVKRFMIDYGTPETPLKIEISYRQREIKQDEYTKINGILVYKINNLAMMKATAYNARDKLRDLYDITFICKNYWNDLQEIVQAMIVNNLEYKGVEQFDYLINNQKDELIDNDKLADDFLEMFEKIGLLSETENIIMKNNQFKGLKGHL